MKDLSNVLWRMRVQQLIAVLTPAPGMVIYILVTADVIQMRYYIFSLLNWVLLLGLLFVLISNYSSMRVRTQRTTDSKSKDGPSVPLDKPKTGSSLVPAAGGSHAPNPGSQVQPYVADVLVPATDA